MLRREFVFGIPLLVGGDFNVIHIDEGKIKGLQVYLQECEDFYFYENSCEIIDVNIKKSCFTWWNDRANNECIFKILDRVIVNQCFWGINNMVKLENLSRVGLDDVCLLLSCSDNTDIVRRPFRFLNL